MGKKLNVRSPSGDTPFGVIFNPDGQVFDNTTLSFVDYAPGDFSDYAIDFSAKGTSSQFFDVELSDTLEAAKYTMCVFTGTKTEGSATHLQDMDVSWDGEKLEDPIKDLYHAEIDHTQDGGVDEYTLSWYRNGVRLEEGISEPDLDVVKRDDGDSKFAEPRQVSEISDTGNFKLDVDDETLSNGEAAIVKATASINGKTRTFTKLVSRDDP